MLLLILFISHIDIDNNGTLIIFAGFAHARFLNLVSFALEMHL